MSHVRRIIKAFWSISCLGVLMCFSQLTWSKYYSGESASILKPYKETLGLPHHECLLAPESGDAPESKSDTGERYLWDEAASEEQALARYLWDESESKIGTSERYLWDEAASEEQALARYLWDESESKMGTSERYLWDEAASEEQALARYLWDESESNISTSERYLWDEAASEEQALARYLWDESDSKIGTSERYLWDESEAKGDLKANVSFDYRSSRAPFVARFLWREFEEQVNPMNSDPLSLEDLFSQDHHLLDKNRDLQIANRSSVDQFNLSAREVQLAGLRYSVRGAADLKFSDQGVAWTIVNQGTDSLSLKEVKWKLPGSTNLEQLIISSDLSAPYSKDIDFQNSGTVGMGGEIGPGEQVQVKLFLDRAPIEDADQYHVELAFKSGHTIAFEPKLALPIQGKNRDSYFPSLIGADDLHRKGITGKGVGVAIIDTGAWDHPAILNNTQGHSRVLAYYNAVRGEESFELTDGNGHGTHITSVLASSEASFDAQDRATGSYHGIAPDANLVVVKAFDEQSKSTYLDVVSAIAYVVQNRERFNIKVMTLAFQGNAVSHYWQDPINQAVMSAWDAGIAVVVSGGNSGPNPMTIGAPGNVPYVITVGAMTDNYTLSDPSDDYIATFSAVGPTLEGFAKPEVTAPGGHMMGLVPEASTVTLEHPDFHDGFHYYLMSGTSQAAAAASGVAALMLQVEPGLTPDNLKCRLMASANAAMSGGIQRFSVLEQGAGLIDAVAAVESKAVGCANQGLDLKADLAGRAHFLGPFNSPDKVQSAIKEAANARQHSDLALEGFETVKTDLALDLAVFNTVELFDTRDLDRSQKYITESALAANNLQWQKVMLSEGGYLIDQPYQDVEELVFDTQFGIDAQLMGSYLLAMKQAGMPEANSVLDAIRPKGTISLPIVLKNAGFIWNLSNPENAGFIWNLSSPENAGFIWNLSSPENAGFIWNLSSPENAGFIWNLSNPENAGFIWNLSSPENAGFIWNLSSPENAGFIWNLSNPENAGFIWNLSNPKNAGFIWNLSSPENAGFIWNLSSPENAGFIWNLSNPENAGFIWNLSSPENAGFIWNLSNPENAGFIWNLSSPENAGFIWNLSSPENAGFIWNLSNPENAGFIWNLSNPENAGFIWNLSNPENAGFIWNLSSPENAGFIWNL